MDDDWKFKIVKKIEHYQTCMICWDLVNPYYTVNVGIIHENEIISKLCLCRTCIEALGKSIKDFTDPERNPLPSLHTTDTNLPAS